MTWFFSNGGLILLRGAALRAPSIAGLVLQGRIYAARLEGHRFNLLLFLFLSTDAQIGSLT